MFLIIRGYGEVLLPLEHTFDHNTKSLKAVSDDFLKDLFKRYEVPVEFNDEAECYVFHGKDFVIWERFFILLEKVENYLLALGGFWNKDEEELFNDSFDWEDHFDIPKRCLDNLRDIQLARIENSLTKPVDC